MEDIKEQKTYSRNELLKLEPLKLHEYLNNNFSIQIPENLDTLDSINMAASLISKATSYYSFLESMRTEANLQKSIYKDAAALAEDEDTKKKYQHEGANMLKREQIFESMVKITDRTYQCISRMVTIKQQMNKEIEMSGKM